MLNFQDLQSLADDAINGVVLFSLGTNVQSEMLGEQRIIAILEAFRKLPKYTFIWKINLEKFPTALPPNVVIRKWVPQNDILGKISNNSVKLRFNELIWNCYTLAHKNTKLFITHAGLLSIQEAIYHGIPMLGVPIFADQFIVNDKIKVIAFRTISIFLHFRIFEDLFAKDLLRFYMSMS